MAQREGGHELQLRRVLPAAPERVFQAWTDPAFLAEWFGPEGMTCPEAQVDLRVGGAYFLAIQMADGQRESVRGEYHEITPPHRLVFTWRWDPPREGVHDEETRVTVELLPTEGGTELQLTHEFFAQEPERDRHGKGWTSTLNSLEQYLAG